ncbi:molybdopterin converting factor small subunit [Natronocella acetinitrilica]|uniref:Molybdopterin converting factor small subunit n=1 Tax=Natronocella acetinitrilica TaxID=414046 RepID=A0AAE3KC39_9GAMM|nr:HrpE/YscL family type III secretion apparatus protein [Natronocella acetinitrilica]MCP1675306.1 molybdopterin converting factor small subunit [Natronocella acetinitrilica]
MTAMSVRETLKLTPEPGQRIVRREEYAQWVEADAMRAEVGQLVQRVRQRISREYERTRASAVRRGTRKGEREAAKRMLGYSETAIRQLYELEQSVKALVAEAVRTLTSEMPAESRLAEVVSALIHELAEDQRVTLHAHPDNRAAIVRLTEDREEVRFRPDKSLGPNQVRLEGPLGVAECDLDAWIEAIAGASP